MSRLLVHVEGDTEETFVNEVLRPHLGRRGYSLVSARLVGNARMRMRRGGIRPWPSVKKDIVAHLKEDPGCLASTMVDYYGLPQSGPGAWPGRAVATSKPVGEKAVTVERALASDIQAAMGAGFDPRRFVPFLAMHEFEGLLFSDCAAFGRGIGRTDLTPAFQKIRNAFSTPEEIDDSPLTAPSKRVEKLLPAYQKPLHGNLAILEIGLDTLRSECPHFNDWLRSLEALVP